MLITDIFSIHSEIVPCRRFRKALCPLCGKKTTICVFQSNQFVKLAGIALFPCKQQPIFICANCHGFLNTKTKSTKKSNPKNANPGSSR